MGAWEEEEKKEKSKGNKKREEKGPAADDGEGPRRTQKGDATKDGEQRQQQPAARAKKQERGRGASAGAGGNFMGTRKRSVGELHGNVCVRVSALFFAFAHKTHMEQQRTLCPAPKKIVFKKYSPFGQSHHRILFSPKRSVSQ